MKKRDDSFSKYLKNIFFTGLAKNLEEQKKVSNIQQKQQNEFSEQVKRVSKYFND